MRDARILLKEGGVAGHMMHLYENPDLSFADIKNVFKMAARGKLAGTEKTDGQNLFVSYSVQDGKAKAARNKGNIKAGGMSAQELAAKFAVRGNLTAAFVESFEAFESATSQLTKQQLIKIFGPDANIFYNAEIMDPRNANVIQYDTKSFVIHQVGHAEFDKETGSVTDTDVSENVKFLNHVIQNELRQEQADSESYRVKMNAVRYLDAMQDLKPYKTAIARLDRLLSKMHLSDDETIADYMIASLLPVVNKTFHNASVEAKKALLKRLLGDKNINSNMVFALFSKEQKQEVRDFIREQPILLKKAIWPLERIIHDFSIEALKGLQSAFILDNEKEVQRLREEVARAIAAIENSGNEEAMEILRMQLEKLQNAENIHTAAEGFVFSYGGNTYKFTGNFAPVNQLLGLFKYGRGDIPAMIKEGDAGDLYHMNGSRRIALVPGAFKPPHKGHLEMVKEYASKVDKVVIFVSPLPRELLNGGEISYVLSKKIWKTYLDVEGLSKKVEVMESPVNSPVAASLHFVANENNIEEWAQPGDTVILGVSTKGGDQSRFTAEKAQKYAREGVTVLGGEELAVSPTAIGGVELSASDMRKAIAEKNVEAFAQFLPDSLQKLSSHILKNILKFVASQEKKRIKEQLIRFIDQRLFESLSKIEDVKKTLNIPREELPQIKNIKDFKDFLAKNKEITYVEVYAPANKLRPIQEEYDPKKVKEFVKWQKENSPKDSKPIVISSDFYIVDGHHRWLASMQINPSKPTKVLKLNLSLKKVLKLAKRYASQLTEGFIEKTYGQIAQKPFQIKMDHLTLDANVHGDERSQRRDNVRLRISDEEIKKVVEKAVPEIMQDVANGEIRQNHIVWVRGMRKNSRKPPLNIIVKLNLQKDPQPDFFEIITLMEKDDFYAIKGTEGPYTVEV